MNRARTRTCLLATTVPAGAALFAAPSAASPAEPAAQAQAEATTVDQVIITGTFRTDRTVTTSASPVDVISANDLVEHPAANMLDELKSLVPSFFVGQNTISDASSIVRSPSL